MTRIEVRSVQPTEVRGHYTVQLVLDDHVSAFDFFVDEFSMIPNMKVGHAFEVLFFEHSSAATEIRKLVWKIHAGEPVALPYIVTAEE